MKKERTSNGETDYMNHQARERRSVIWALKCLIGAMVLCGVLSTMGCGGLIARHIETGQEGTYAELKNSMAPVSPGSGRLFVYMVDGAPNPMNTMGAGNCCTVDKQVYKFLGKTYWYVDLQTGMHKVTADGVLGGFGSVQYGKSAVEFDLKEGEIKYCRIDLGGFGWGGAATFTPTMVEPSVAELELPNLDWYKNFKYDKTVE